MQYSSLKQIDKTNVSKLELAWTHLVPGRSNRFPFSPLISGGVMYVIGKGPAIVALDATTGRQIWSHPVDGTPTSRGINYWESKDRSDQRLIFSVDSYLQELNARTGVTINTFGNDGPELAALPWVLRGHSGGGIWSDLMTTLYPDRVAAAFCDPARSATGRISRNPRRPPPRTRSPSWETPARKSRSAAHGSPLLRGPANIAARAARPELPPIHARAMSAATRVIWRFLSWTPALPCACRPRAAIVKRSSRWT